MRRVFENSVNPAHSTSIARPCDGGVSELFRSCFFALAMFSRRWRENIASVPAGLFSPCGLKTHGLQVRFAHPSKCAPCGHGPPGVPAGLLARWAKRTAFRFASLTLRTSPRAGVARPGFRMAYFRPAGSKRTASRFASLTLRNAPRAGTARPGFRPAYWPVGPNARPSGSLRSPSELRPVRAWPARGSAWLIFALRAQNAHAPGSLRSPSELRPARATPARGSAWLIFALWAQTARPPGPLRSPLRTSPRAGTARPGFRPAYWPVGLKTHMLQVRFAHPPNFAPCGRGPHGVPAGFQVRTGWTRLLVRRGC